MHAIGLRWRLRANYGHPRGMNALVRNGSRPKAGTLVGILLAVFALTACPRSDATDSPDAAQTPDAFNPTDGRTGRACNALDMRITAPEVFVGPTGYTAQFKNLMDSAQTSIKLTMYVFTVNDLINGLVAAKQRGVAVQVLLDPDHMGNGNARSKLAAAGIEVKNSPSVFEYSHAKYMVIDDQKAVISSGNFNFSATNSERNYGLITSDADDVADLNAIFAADWTQTAPALACTRLLFSPVNSRSRLIAHIDSSTRTLDLELMYLSDSDIRSAVTRANDRGVVIRVILASARDFSNNAATITSLKTQNIPVHIATTFDMHAKLIIADGVAFVGSENMSYTSLTKNREVGALVFEKPQAALIQAQFDADWASEPAAE
jgi:cardiolipin synthase A/B